MKTANNSTQLLRPAQVARRLGIARKRVITLIKYSALPAIDLGPRLTRITEADLSAFIESRRIKPRQWPFVDVPPAAKR
jgi:excisionase family DNA binding protein